MKKIVPPKKPTRTYGTIVFGTDGSVRNNLTRLPDNKEEQEASVVNWFCQGLQVFHGLSVKDVRPLPQDGHDASIIVNAMPVQPQVSELVQREFELPAGTPNGGDPKALAFFDAASVGGVSLDIDSVNDSIVRGISRKLDKHYAKPTGNELWLVLFTTSSFIPTLCWKDGALVVEEPLRRAREHSANSAWQPFDQVWFTDMRTSPVRVLPS